MATQGLILKTNTEKGVECYIGYYYSIRWNQYEGNAPVLFLSTTDYIIAYVNCPIVWASLLQREIDLITMEVECIAISESMRFV